MIRGLVLSRPRPHPQVVGAIADHEVLGVREQVQVVLDLSESVRADLAGDAAIGDGQAQRIAESLEELRKRFGRANPSQHRSCSSQ